MAKETRKQTPNPTQAQAMRVPRSFADMERFMDRFTRSFPMAPWRTEWPDLWVGEYPDIKLPKVDVLDLETEIVVKAEIPGVDKKDLDISVNEDSVTLKGSTRQEQKTEKGDYFRSEITQGTFSRTISLPASVDGSKAKAMLKDGMLEIKLPKLKGSMRHTINIE